MKPRKNTKMCACKIEFIENIDRIEGMLKLGYSKRYVHNLLVEGKIIEMSYKSFINYAGKVECEQK